MLKYLIDKLNRLEWYIFQYKLQIKIPFTYNAIVQRRVEVECILLDVANNKRDLLTKEQCRKIALYMGDLTIKKLEI